MCKLAVLITVPQQLNPIVRMSLSFGIDMKSLRHMKDIGTVAGFKPFLINRSINLDVNKKRLK